MLLFGKQRDGFSLFFVYVWQIAEAERTCVELQRAASMLEGRLAELDHWNTDALDCCDQLQEKILKGRSASQSTTKVRKA